MSPLCYVGWEMECLRNMQGPQPTVVLNRGTAGCRITPTTRNGECPAHTGPRLGWVGVWKARKQGSLREDMACGSSQVWRLLQEDSGGEWAGAGAKGPERQMSPISVLPQLA